MTTPDPIAELYRVEGRAEVIRGKVVNLPLSGAMPGFASDEILFSLRAYSKRTGHGRAFGNCNGFLVDLPDRQSFSPNAGYYVGPAAGMEFFKGAPVFAVEVRDESDYGHDAECEMAAKRADYFAAGTLVVWDVDLLDENVVRVYRDGNGEQPAAVYRLGQTAEAEPAVPGWTMPVNDLFADPAMSLAE